MLVRSRIQGSPEGGQAGRQPQGQTLLPCHVPGRPQPPGEMEEAYPLSLRDRALPQIRMKADSRTWLWSPLPNLVIACQATPILSHSRML